MPEDVSFTFRIPKKLNDRLMNAIAATENEVTRSGVCIQALEQFLAQLDVCPSMLKNYTPMKDRSSRHYRPLQRKKRSCKAEEED